MRATRVALLLITVLGFTAQARAQYCYIPATGQCTQMASVFEPCAGQVVASCPGVTPTPTPVPPPTPTATPTYPTATPTPAAGCISVPSGGTTCPSGYVLSCCRAPDDHCTPFHDACYGIRMCCPSGGPVATPTPVPGITPTPTMTPRPTGATPTPTPTIPAPTPSCLGYGVSYPVTTIPYTLDLYCGASPCLATWPGGMLQREPWTTGPPITIVPTTDGVLVSYAAREYVYPQRCQAAPLRPMDDSIHCDPR